MAKTMFNQTVEVALQIATERGLDSESKENIRHQIEAAFFAYAESWKGVHTSAETFEKWAYFHDELKRTQGATTLEQLYESLTKTVKQNPDAWTIFFRQVVISLMTKGLSSMAKMCEECRRLETVTVKTMKAGFCRNCGKVILRCPKCGEPLKETSPDTTTAAAPFYCVICGTTFNANGSEFNGAMTVGEKFEEYREAYKKAYGKYPKVKIIGESED